MEGKEVLKGLERLSLSIRVVSIVVLFAFVIVMIGYSFYFSPFISTIIFIVFPFTTYQINKNESKSNN